MKAFPVAWLQGGATGEDSEFWTGRCKTEPVQQQTDEVGDLRPCRASLKMKLINHQMKHALVTLQPLSGGLENGSSASRMSIMDNIEWLVIRMSGGSLLHVPSGPHFGAVETWKEVDSVAAMRTG